MSFNIFDIMQIVIGNILFIGNNILCYFSCLILSFLLFFMFNIHLHFNDAQTNHSVFVTNYTLYKHL